MMKVVSGVRESVGQVEIPTGCGLRAELALRGLHWAERRGLRYERTDGSVPGIVFAEEERGHGNFHPRVWAALAARPEWARRLAKVHTASRRVRARADWRWRELDCAASSDALLMNVFCWPGLMERASVRALLGVDRGVEPEFGVKPRTPLAGGRFDCTEIDLRLGDLLVEAKLTEADFQTAAPGLVTRYAEFAAVFDAGDLPVRCAAAGGERVAGYQLIRGTLAAQATGGAFCVLCDARRPDLAEVWFRVLRAVRCGALRSRLKLLTWQELASALPREQREFLAEKYGIVAPE
jgi:hypothetical protein